MILLNPWLLGGLAAVAVPVLVHIIHQRKVTLHRFSAMRFLVDMMARSRSRLLMDQWLLLLVRSAAVLALALALTRPARQPSSEAAGVERQGKTAAVILFDDSLSSAAGRNDQRLRRMQELTYAYLDTLQKGDEVSLIRLTTLAATADPLFDHEAVREQVAAIEPGDLGSDHAQLLDAGLKQLERHVNPNTELVLVSDGLADGWRAHERLRWNELREALQRDPEARPGSRGSPRLVVLAPGDTGRLSNLALTAIELDRSVVAVDQTVALSVSVEHHGEQPPSEAILRLQADGRIIAERQLDLGLGERRRLVFSHRFTEAGSHALEAVIEGARDDLAADDQRALAVEVVRGLPVLVVEGRRAAGLAGGGAFVAAALDPEGAGQGLFAIERIASTQLNGVRLADYRAVVLCDAPALDADALAAIERYVAEGGGVLVAFGPATDAQHVNRMWARDGEGFLPCPLGPLQDLERSLVPRVEFTAHRAMAPFVGSGGEAWSDAQVRSYHALATGVVPAGDLAVLLRLENGDPLLVLRRRGLGQVAMLATSLDLSWSELPIRAAFVPLLRGVMGHLGGQVLPPRNLRPGQQLAFVRERSVSDPQAADPTGRPVPLVPDSWEGRQVFASPPVATHGVYTVHDGDRVLLFTVSPLPEESALVRSSEQLVASALGPLPVLDLRSAKAVADTFAVAQSGDLELWRYLIMACLALLFVETALTRRQAGRERGRT